MYWDIGRMIQQRQQMEGWGTGIIPKLARDIRNEFPEIFELTLDLAINHRKWAA